MRCQECTIVHGEGGDLLIATGYGDCIIGHEDVKKLLLSGKTVAVTREHTGTGAITIEGYALLNRKGESVIIFLSAEFMQTSDGLNAFFIPLTGMNLVAEGKAVSAPLLPLQNRYCLHSPSEIMRPKDFTVAIPSGGCQSQNGHPPVPLRSL